MEYTRTYLTAYVQNEQAEQAMRRALEALRESAVHYRHAGRIGVASVIEAMTKRLEKETDQ